MTKKLPLILSVLSLFAIGIYFGKNNFFKSSQQPETTANQENGGSTTFEVTQTIDFGNQQTPEEQTLTADQGQTALQVLQNSQAIEIKDYDFGTIVESINGTVNGTDNKFWIYSVNDQEMGVGASAYQVQPGDSIQWKFEAYEE